MFRFFRSEGEKHLSPILVVKLEMIRLDYSLSPPLVVQLGILDVAPASTRRSLYRVHKFVIDVRARHVFKVRRWCPQGVLPGENAA